MTLYPDLPTMQFDNRPTDVQSHSQSDIRDAGLALHVDARYAVEALPDTLLFFWWQAWPSVPYRYPGLGSLCGKADVHRLIGGRVLQCVGQVVRHHLYKAIGVGVNVDRFLHNAHNVAGGQQESQCMRLHPRGI